MKAPEQRFWEKVEEKGPDDCWPWTAHTTTDGYGRIRFGGKMRLAHRVAWELANGPIPDGLCACHRCDTPLCCNPGHLFLGTNADNTADRGAKGRTARNTQTHCIRGHALTNDNLRWSANAGSVGGRGRTCRICFIDYQREYRAAIRARKQKVGT